MAVKKKPAMKKPGKKVPKGKKYVKYAKKKKKVKAVVPSYDSKHVPSDDGPQYKGPTIEFMFDTKNGGPMKVRIKAWTEPDIKKRVRVRENQPLIVVQLDNQAPVGFAALKTCISDFIIREHRYDWRNRPWHAILYNIAHLWARVTMPNNPMVQKQTEYLEDSTYDYVREQLSHVVRSAGAGEWWLRKRVRELKIA